MVLHEHDSVPTHPTGGRSNWLNVVSRRIYETTLDVRDVIGAEKTHSTPQIILCSHIMSDTFGFAPGGVHGEL